MTTQPAEPSSSPQPKAELYVIEKLILTNQGLILAALADILEAFENLPGYAGTDHGDVDGLRNQSAKLALLLVGSR